MLKVFLEAARRTPAMVLSGAKFTLQRSCQTFFCFVLVCFFFRGCDCSSAHEQTAAHGLCFRAPGGLKLCQLKVGPLTTDSVLISLSFLGFSGKKNDNDPTNKENEIREFSQPETSRWLIPSRLIALCMCITWFLRSPSAQWQLIWLHRCTFLFLFKQ